MQKQQKQESNRAKQEQKYVVDEHWLSLTCQKLLELL